jgi:hypothetical protein
VTALLAVEEGEVDGDRCPGLVEPHGEGLVHLVEEERCVAFGARRLGRRRARDRRSHNSGKVRKTWISARRTVIPGMVFASVMRRVSDGSSAPSMLPVPSTTMP